jgi:hypothetical protein
MASCKTAGHQAAQAAIEDYRRNAAEYQSARPREEWQRLLPLDDTRTVIFHAECPDCHAEITVVKGK